MEFVYYFMRSYFQSSFAVKFGTYVVTLKFLSYIISQSANQMNFDSTVLCNFQTLFLFLKQMIIEHC